MVLATAGVELAVVFTGPPGPGAVRVGDHDVRVELGNMVSIVSMKPGKLARSCCCSVFIWPRREIRNRKSILPLQPAGLPGPKSGEPPRSRSGSVLAAPLSSVLVVELGPELLASLGPVELPAGVEVGPGWLKRSPCRPRARCTPEPRRGRRGRSRRGSTSRPVYRNRARRGCWPPRSRPTCSSAPRITCAAASRPSFHRAPAPGRATPVRPQRRSPRVLGSARARWSAARPIAGCRAATTPNSAAAPVNSSARRPTPPRLLGPIARGRSTSRRRRSTAPRDGQHPAPPRRRRTERTQGLAAANTPARRPTPPRLLGAVMRRRRPTVIGEQPRSG
jgi:hypothetical protein